MEELEVRLGKYRLRRQKLEQKFQLRSSTLTEFSAVRDEKIKKVSSSLESQNVEARERHLTLLRDISSQVHHASSMCSKFESRVGSHTRLKEAKLEYLKSVEKMMPVFRMNSTNKRLEKVRELQEMKLVVEKRRQLRLSLEQQDLRAQSMLDHERRDYLLQRSLEQRDELHINSRNLVSKIHNRETDSAILKAVDHGLTEEQHRYQDKAQRSRNVDKEKNEFMQKFHEYHPPESSDDGLDGSSRNDDCGGGSDSQENGGEQAVYRSPTRLCTSAGEQSSPYGFLASSPSVKLKARETFDESSGEAPSSSIIRAYQDVETMETTSTENVRSFDEDSTTGPVVDTSPIPSRLSPLKHEVAVVHDAKEGAEEGNNVEEEFSLQEYTEVLNQIFIYVESLERVGNDSGPRRAYVQHGTMNVSTNGPMLTKTVKLAGRIPSEFALTEVVALLLFVLKEVGPGLFPFEALNGVVTLDKHQKLMKKFGGGRVELLKIITDHLQRIVWASDIEANEVCTLFTSPLVLFIDELSERGRAERKVNKLLQLAALKDGTGRSTSPSSPAPSSPVKTTTTIDGPLYNSNNSIRALISKGAKNVLDDEFDEFEDIDEISAPPPMRDLVEESEIAAVRVRD